MDVQDKNQEAGVRRALAALRRASDLSEGRDPRGAWALEAEDIPALVRDDARGARELLDAALCGQRPDLALEELKSLNALRFFSHVERLPGFGGGAQGHKDLWDHTKKVVAQSEARPVIRWAALYHDVGKIMTLSREGKKVSFHGHEGVGSRMFLDFAKKSRLFSGEEAAKISDVIFFLGRVEAFEGEWTDSAVRRLMMDLGDRLEDVVSLSSADITTGRDEKRRAILRSIDRLRERVASLREAAAAPRLPKGLGTALVEQLGFPQNKSLRDAMLRLETMLREGDIPTGSTVDDVVRIAREKGVVPQG